MIDSNRILKINTVKLNKNYTMTELVKKKKGKSGKINYSFSFSNMHLLCETIKSLCDNQP